MTVSGASYEAHFLGETQRETKTLRLGILDSTGAFRTGFFFEPFSPYPLYFWYHFDRLRQEILVTIQFSQGDRLQGRVRILQLPAGEIPCPALLPSDFEDQQKLQMAYQCLVDAGVRVEISLQFKDYSVTLPVLLSSESDYAAAEEAMRQIASRVSSGFIDAMQAFKAFLDDETIQALGRCLLGNVTQPSAVRMIPLGECSRPSECLGCSVGIASKVLGWVGLFFSTGGTGPAIVGVLGLYMGTISGAWAMGTNCVKCIRGCNGGDPPPPRRGGGCSRCPNVSLPTLG